MRGVVTLRCVAWLRHDVFGAPDGATEWEDWHNDAVPCVLCSQTLQAAGNDQLGCPHDAAV